MIFLDGLYHVDSLQRPFEPVNFQVELCFFKGPNLIQIGIQLQPKRRGKIMYFLAKLFVYPIHDKSIDQPIVKKSHDFFSMSANIQRQLNHRFLKK
jgi:hypothetical protein